MDTHSLRNCEICLYKSKSRRKYTCSNPHNFVKIGMKLPFAWRTNAEKQFKIWGLKTTILNPPKSKFFGFLRKTSPKNVFFVFRLWFSFKNNWRINVLLVSIFENALKKAISCQKCHFISFLLLLTFFSAFKKMTKTTYVCVSFVFKATQKKNMRKYLCLGFCFKSWKPAFLEVNYFCFTFFLHIFCML